MLMRAGYDLDRRTGILLRAGYDGLAYSDGDEVEQRIGAVIEAAGDLSVLSEELREHCIDWPSLYHLSSSRANLLRPFERHLGGNALEIGAGCGAITRYLGECGGNVLALEGSPRRAAIARSRTRDLPNVTVVAERFEDFRCDAKFDVVTLVGVLEYANLFTSGSSPALAILEQARSLLNPDGLLVIGIENQLGLKYFAGAAEDHIGRAMYGIEGRYRGDQPQTFGRKVLSDLLAQAGYHRTNFLAPFPDYKLPISIIAESGFLAPDFDAATLASQSVPYDPQLPKVRVFSPESAWPIVAQNGLALDMANSFLVAASNGDGPVIERSSLAWHYSTGRRKAWCKETRFVRTQDGQIEVRYHLLGEVETGAAADAGPLRLEVPEKSAYVNGQPLSQEIVQILSHDGWTFDEVRQFFSKYILILEGIMAEAEGGGPEKHKIDNPDRQLPGFFFDVMPHNIIVAADGTHHVIDKEWDLAGGVSAGFLMFRSLLDILSVTSRIGHSSEAFEATPLGLVTAIMDVTGWPVTQETIIRYAEFESTIQSAVQGGARKPDELLAWLSSALVRDNLGQRVEKDGKELIRLGEVITQRDVEIGSLNRLVAQRDSEIASLSHAVAEHDARIAELSRMVEQRDGKIRGLSHAVAERDARITELNRMIAELHASTSWRTTAPLRWVGRQIRRARWALRLLPDALVLAGGVGSTTRKAIRILRGEGLAGVRNRLRYLEAKRQPVAGASSEPDKQNADAWPIVPYYVDPRLDADSPETPEGLSVAVHLHLFYDEMLEEIAGRLANIPCHFDLYVSVPEGRDCGSTATRLQAHLPRVGQLIVEQVPNRGRDLAPLIVQFGKRLSQYSIVGHFHTKKSPHNEVLSKWGEELLDHLLGAVGSSGGRVAHLFALLQSRAKLIYPEGRTGILKDETGWADDREIARAVLERYTSLSIEQFPYVEFPEGAMFWARSACLHEFLNLPLSFDNFPEEPIAVDGTLAHALERLILILARDYEGEFLRLHHGDSIQDYRAYEERKDFSNAIVHDDIKVLAYYLPQFHPIPENDEWHGTGFTEWTKVRSANPLFEGHYQQHIPHPDIGYYLLDDPETLRVQADLMRTAGIHGMVFYHYWFGGRMILERPARMLLDSPDIAMPYCFCWANENWTRRWDGNESEILLAQQYSPEDARAFIHYLLPFFRDPRHLRVDGRPVLFIYRPASIPDVGTYIDIWGEECRAAGLQAPYVVAVLTRGAMNPGEFGMDAGVERVLRDWTYGHAPEIKTRLKPYASINGSVLSYDDVASFYSAQTDAKDFTYFRSLVPIWDNTARYGSEALIVHGSTPQRFQEWLESAIRYSRQNLPADRRLVVINAWNEWAEGAHLEPDTRYGYAYLNAIGRALSDLPYSAQLNPSDIQVDGTRIHLVFPSHVREWLAADPILAQRFFHTLARSSVFTRCVVTIDAELSGQFPLPAASGKPDDAELVLEFRKLAFFGPHTIEKMVQTALTYPESVVVPNFYQGDWPLVPVTANGSIRSADAYHSPLMLLPAHMPKFGFKNFRMRTDAQCFVAQPNSEPTDRLPAVTTIIRIHKSADFELLRDALCCLAAMRNCICVPLIAAQDLSPEQSHELTAMLDDFAWYPDHMPKVYYYRSSEGNDDLRSRMLNESLRKVETRYAGFLDYDDLLMPHAYEWLIDRLRTTGKAVAFGRVFCTTFSSSTGLRLARSRRYERGYSYEEFIQNNHAPLHSFLMDMSQIDVSDVIYYDNQRYMEDYLLTLQIFRRDNCDWDSLSQNVYIGEYIHSIDRPHTLAFASEAERKEMLTDPLYQLCESRIVETRLRLAQDSVAAR
jgi:lipopolysaccharide biosynthesis protein/SAM-dependent methyltransferase